MAKKIRIINPYTGFDSANVTDSSSSKQQAINEANERLRKRREEERLRRLEELKKTTSEYYRDQDSGSLVGDKGFATMASSDVLEARKKAEDADPLGLGTMPNGNAAGPQNRTDVAKAKQAHDERLAREARILAAEQLMEQEGWAKVGNEVVYKTPFSPLPNPDKKYTLPDGKQVTARGNKALAPGLYGITPDEYVQAMGAFDRYRTLGEPEEKPETLVGRYAGWTDDQKYAAQNYISDSRGGYDLGDALAEMREAGLTDEQINTFRMEMSDALNSHEYTDERMDSWFEPAQEAVPMYSERQKKILSEYDEALKLLGVDAEQFSGEDASKYYERYGNLYGAERDSKENPYYDAEGPLKVTQEQAEAWAMRPISHTTQDEQFDLVRWGVMTQEEKDAYNTILRDYGEEAAKNYLQTKEGELNQRVTQKEQLEHGQLAMENPFLASVVNPLERMKGAVGQGEMWLEELLTGKAPDEYDLRRLNTRLADSTVANVGQKIENNVDGFAGQALSFGYQTVMSLADMGANMLVFGPAGAAATGGAMGLSAAASTYNNVIDRGGDHNTANAMAGVAGIAEILGEKYSIEGLWKIAKGGGLGSAVKNIVRQMGIEWSEETATEVANQIGDYLLMGDLSMLKQEGAGAVAKEIGLAGLGGALMGGLSGGAAQGVHAVTSNIANRQEDNRLKKAAEIRAKQQLAEQKEQDMLESLPADMPVQETAVPEYAMAEQHATADQDAQRRNQEAQMQEQMSADQEAQQRARQQELEQENAAQDAEMRGKATENASKAAQADEMGKAQAEEKKAANEAKKRDKQRAFQQKQEAIALSEDGANEPVSVTGIDHVEDGAVYVTVTDAAGVERVESAADLDFATETGELLSNIGSMDERAVQAYIDNYDRTLSSPAEYSRAFIDAYERARIGLDAYKAVAENDLAQKYLSKDAAAAAWYAGTSRYDMENGVQVGMTLRAQEMIIDKLNKLTGYKIRLTDQDLGGANAKVNTDTHEILIATNAENGAYSYFAVHEVVHQMKADNPEAWSRFQAVVLDALDAHDVDIAAEMQHVTELYKKQGKELSLDEAYEEVICNTAPTFLQDKEIVKDLISRDRTMMEKFTDMLRDFINKVGNVLQNLGKDMGKLGSWQGMQALRDDHENNKAIYNCLMECLEETKNQQAQQSKQDVSDNNVVKLSAKENEHYDYSKPFAEQVEDLREGRFPERRSLLVSGTPEVLQKIGFSKLPLMINQDHLMRMERDTEHVLSKEMIRQLPELMKDPVAVIGSEGNSDSSIVMILKAIVNGKPYIAPVYITSESHANSARIDSNNIATVFRKGNAISKLLENAVQKENADKIGVYYWKKTEARDLFEGAGVQFSGSSIQDGLVHSIFDVGSPVNRGYMEQTETKQFDRWFKGSKVINADGTPKVMYRGGGEDISVFDRKKSKASNLYGRGFYFTDSEAHAKQYGEARSYYLHIANPLNAESGAKNITPKQMRAFLEAVAEDEDYGLENYGYGASVDSVLKALKGKSDFDALQDINATAIGDFVAAIELFNEVNGTNYDGIITPTETVVFDSKQIKSATDNVGLFDPDNPNVKFSMRETVEETRDLLAVHNLTEENMRGALELGGLAMPSIAVVKAEQGHSQYGPISAIFDKGTIDPKASSANEIYGGDAWTPTFPQVEYEVAEEVEKRISDKYYEISEKYGNSAARPLYAYATDLENTVNRSGGVERIIEKMKSDTSVMQAYLADSGQQMVEPVVKTTVKRMPASQVAMYDSMIKKLGEETMRSFETPKGESPISYRRAWMDEHGEAVKQAYIETLMDELALDENIASEAAKDTKAMKRTLLDAYRYMKNGPETREEVTDYEATDEAIRAAVDSKAYEEWLNGLFAGAVKGKGIRNDKSLFTPSGNRRSFAATHWDVTLDNVVRAMRSEEKTGVGSIGGRNIEGAAVKQYSSIKDMKADSDRLQTIDQDEYDAMRKGFRDRFSAIARDYAGDGDWFDAGDVLVEAVTKHQTADGIYKYISKYADLYKPSKQVADDLYALVEEMKNAPTGYFEAKPRRAIGFDEIAAVIVPDNLSDDVRTALVDAGVNMIEYEAGNEADRLDKMNGEAVSTLKFSLRETDSNVQESLATEEELFAATHGHRMTEEEAVKMAKKLKKIAHSDMDTNVLAKKLMDLYDYAERGTKISIEAFDTMKNALAEEIMATSKTLDMEHEERMQPIRDYFRNKPIQLTSEQQREAANLVGSLGEYRKMVFGRIRLGQKGTRLDTLWGELTDLDAELFPADASESEMAKLLLDAVDAMAPVYQNASGMNAMESHQWLAGEMNRLYFAQKGVKASVKEQREFGMKLEQYEQVMDRFQDEHKKLFNEAMAKANASMDEEKAQLVQQAEQQRRLDRLEAEADASKYAKEQIASVEAKTAAEMEAYRTALKLKDKEWREKYRANAKETSRKQRYRAQIARIVNDLTKKLEKPTDKKHIKAGLDEAVLEFLQELDLGSKNKTTRNLSDRIRKLTEALNEAKNGTENGSDTQYLIDPDLLEELKELTKKVEGIGSLPELNADQMREMRNAVRDVAHIVTTADKMFAMQKSMTAAQAGQQTIEELSHKKDKKQRQGATAMVDEMVNTAQLDSFRFFD